MKKHLQSFVFFMVCFVLSPVLCTATCPTQASITYTCPFTPTAPTIDGAASSAEWPGSPQLNIASPINTFFYCMVDGSNLYILVDAVGDTTQSTAPLACDECLIQFHNGTISNLVEIHSQNGTSNTTFIPAGGVGMVGFGSSQNSGTPHRLYEWKFPFSSIGTNSGGQIYFSAPAFPKAACGADASMPYDGATGRDNEWPPCFSQGDLTTWGILQFPADSDGDGIPDDIEDAAPNNGDGNGDGIPDKYQRNVSSLPSATGNGYLTLQIDEPVSGQSYNLKKHSANGISGDCQNANVQALTEASQSQQDGGFSFPFGLLSFQTSECIGSLISGNVRGAQQAGEVLVTVYYHGATNISSLIYRKYGPFPTFSGTVQWYTMPGVTFGTATVGTISVPTASFTITDNSTGDDDGTLGIIVDQGGLGDPAVSIPTMTEWGMIIFIVLAGLSSVYYLRRQRRA